MFRCACSGGNWRELAGTGGNLKALAVMGRELVGTNGHWQGTGGTGRELAGTRMEFVGTGRALATDSRFKLRTMDTHPGAWS